jgi:hypothetical protein
MAFLNKIYDERPEADGARPRLHHLRTLAEVADGKGVAVRPPNLVRLPVTSEFTQTAQFKGHGRLWSDARNPTSVPTMLRLGRDKSCNSCSKSIWSALLVRRYRKKQVRSIDPLGRHART